MAFTDEEKKIIREMQNEYHRNYARKNREKVNEYQRNWNKKNREKVKEYNARWMLRKYQAQQEQQ